MQLYFTDRKQWRDWLEAHGAEHNVVWLVFYKKHTKQPSLNYGAAVEEAICCGWIDSLVKRIDDDRYMRKFTPRRDFTKWSQPNLKRLRSLIETGRVQKPVLAKIPSEIQALPAVGSRSLEPSEDLTAALEADPVAREFFEQLAPSYRRNYIAWVDAAKRKSTRERRIKEAIETMRRGEKLGMK